ncbi:DUF1456 family protein [Flavobacterium tegetincola]|uniref:DUF1456 family protein n=1 Tax=Flavobacterium tegetincola TaxID=150172 RepID=UPI0004028DD3|nr:DUF1456 family protein [Flavobacterium tegetincola]
MNNNDIFKKLRVALQLRDDQIVDILKLVDFNIEKPELNALFRADDHPNYMECGDQVLRNFLNGLIIHLRGTKEEPKNAMDVISKNRDEVNNRPKTAKPAGSSTAPKGKPSGSGKPYSSNKPVSSTGKPAFKGNDRSKKKEPKIEVVEKVRYKNGKK